MNAVSTGWQKKFYILCLFWALVAIVAYCVLFSYQSAHYVVIGALVLLIGFKITEYLVAILTGVRRANGTAIALLFLAKLTWWVGLFLLSKKIPQGMGIAISFGLASFLCAVLTFPALMIGLPKISPANSEEK